MTPLKHYFTSFAELHLAISRNIDRIPADIDLVVGIPRSGMIPAYTVALLLNLPVVDVHSFLENRGLGHGRTRPLRRNIDAPFEAQKILLVDDSYFSGQSLAGCLETIANAGYKGQIVTCVAIVEPSAAHKVDVSFLEVPMPRVFEWNLFHHKVMANACLDFDGVLCVDPTEDVNDDGPKYRDFLENVKPLHIPTAKVGHIVSARLEKYRPECEAWLAKHGVQYGQLHLVDLPSKEERQRLQAHIPHKAKVYKESGAKLFVESDERQARKIADRSGRPVLSLETMRVHHGDGLYLHNMPVHLEASRSRMRKLMRRAAVRAPLPRVVKSAFRRVSKAVAALF